MRKWIIGLLVAVVIINAGVYALIPAKLVVAEVVPVSANPFTAFRCLTSAGTVQDWLKKEQASIKASGKNSVTVTSDDYIFTLAPQMYNVVAVDMGKENVSSYISILALAKDSSLVEWKTELPASNNVFKRIHNYWQAKSLKTNMASVLDQYADFIQNSELVYGVKIQHETVKDTMLVTTKMFLPDYPTPQEYYNMIQRLQQHIVQHGAQEANFPMLNIKPDGSGRFETTVAIPVNKIVPSAGEILFKRMIPGNILITEVAGGKHTIESGFRHIENYITENRLTSPAIPFQSLVTNRLAESDTAKWVTRLYYPVI
jgi:hypothetical protein